ncbi:hypothetical protein [Ammoniphilus sp. YIM 78166]|uniref:hypothetical protein n=1 Tax=Ammoniphilus sp. YIM 78166 TaxID=1644106 RepID=UPI00107036E1|nr:hypothetical protein [Ammoniphilus sp. YIM 78166]
MNKFWMAIVGAGLVIANKGLGLNLSEEAIYTFGRCTDYIYSRSGVCSWEESEIIWIHLRHLLESPSFIIERRVSYFIYILCVISVRLD